MSVERVGYILLLDLLAGTGEEYSTAINYLIVPPDTGHSATALAALIVFGLVKVHCPLLMHPSVLQLFTLEKYRPTFF